MTDFIFLNIENGFLCFYALAISKEISNLKMTILKESPYEHKRVKMTKNNLLFDGQILYGKKMICNLKTRLSGEYVYYDDAKQEKDEVYIQEYDLCDMIPLFQALSKLEKGYLQFLEYFATIDQRKDLLSRELFNRHKKEILELIKLKLLFKIKSDSLDATLSKLLSFSKGEQRVKLLTLFENLNIFQINIDDYPKEVCKEKQISYKFKPKKLKRGDI